MKDILYLKKSKMAKKINNFAFMKRLILTLLICMPSILGAQNTMSVLNSMHQVKKGETLLSIAKQYNVTEQDLLLMNPEIKKKGKLKKGTYVTIPSVRTEQTEVAVLDEKTVKEISNIKIGVILPFEEKTERAKKMVEFFQGFLMAADSVKKEGISLDIYAFSCGNKESELMQVLMKPEVATLDIIFGPVDEQQISAAVNFCKINKIKLMELLMGKIYLKLV